MGGLKGSNSGYDPEPNKDEVELEVDYNSFGNDQEFKDKDESLPPEAQKDSGYFNDKLSVASSSRASKGALEDELGYSSDESVGHIRIEWCNFEEVGGLPPLADDAL